MILPPVPYGVQGVVCLTDTSAECSVQRVVPGFHRQLVEWTAGGGRMGPESWSVPRGGPGVDPAESELPAECGPPGEGDGLPCALTTLGQRLVGLVDWPPDADAARL